MKTAVPELKMRRAMSVEDPRVQKLAEAVPLLAFRLRNEVAHYFDSA
jgi:hypothetical protein